MIKWLAKLEDSYDINHAFSFVMRLIYALFAVIIIGSLACVSVLFVICVFREIF